MIEDNQESQKNNEEESRLTITLNVENIIDEMIDKQLPKATYATKNMIKEIALRATQKALNATMERIQDRTSKGAVKE